MENPPNSIEMQIDNFLEQFKRSASKAMDGDWTSTSFSGSMPRSRSRLSCFDMSEFSGESPINTNLGHLSDVGVPQRLSKLRKRMCGKAISIFPHIFPFTQETFLGLPMIFSQSGKALLRQLPLSPYHEAMFAEADPIAKQLH